jgi:hypothetical protein
LRWPLITAWTLPDGSWFSRVEPRRPAPGFVTGLLADIEVKTCWQPAEQAGHASPDAR